MRITCRRDCNEALLDQVADLAEQIAHQTFAGVRNAPNADSVYAPGGHIANDGVYIHMRWGGYKVTQNIDFCSRFRQEMARKTKSRLTGVVEDTAYVHVQFPFEI